MTNPGKLGAWLKTLLNVWVWAAILAAVICIAKRPADVPTREQEITARIISGDIDAAVDAKQSVTVKATSIDLSQHVRSRVKKVAIVPLSKFKRAFVTLDEGKVRLGVEEDLFGYPIFSTIEYQAAVVDGKFAAEKTGMYIGRLGIPPQVNFLDGLFSKFATSLKQEQKVLDKAKSISLTKDQAIVVTKP